MKKPWRIIWRNICIRSCWEVHLLVYSTQVWCDWVGEPKSPQETNSRGLSSPRTLSHHFCVCIWSFQLSDWLVNWWLGNSRDDRRRSGQKRGMHRECWCHDFCIWMCSWCMHPWCFLSFYSLSVASFWATKWSINNWSFSCWVKVFPAGLGARRYCGCA